MLVVAVLLVPVLVAGGSAAVVLDVEVPLVVLELPVEVTVAALVVPDVEVPFVVLELPILVLSVVLELPVLVPVVVPELFVLLPVEKLLVLLLVELIKAFPKLLSVAPILSVGYRAA